MAAPSRPDRTLKDRARGMFRTQFTCACCPGRTFHGYRAMNAHHMARHGSYWAGDKARRTGRKIGKTADAMRKHARGYREAYGHIDRLGRATGKGRSRPDGPVRRISDLRARHRHDRDHERAARRDGRAAQATGRDRHHTANRHQRAADAQRSRWPQRPAPARTPPTARPAPSRVNGTRPQPSRLAPVSRNGRTP